MAKKKSNKGSELKSDEKIKLNNEPESKNKKGLLSGILRILTYPFRKVGQFIKFLVRKSFKPSARGRNWQFLVLVFILAFLAFNLDITTYWNSSADYLNGQIKKIPNDYLNKVRIPDFYERSFLYGLDLKGGIELIYKANFDDSLESTEEKLDSLEGIRDVIERRVNLFGVSEGEVRSIEFGEQNGIMVSLPGVTDKEEAKEMIGETPFIDFREEKSPEEQAEMQAILEDENADLENFDLNDFYYKKTELTGKHIKDAGLQYDQYTGEPEIVLVFNDEGKEIFGDLTGRNVGKRIGIFLDDQIVSAPTVREKIESESASITGIGDIEEAETLKRRLNAGALPVEIELESERSVEATLGEKVLDKGIKAGLYGGIAVVVFMLLMYRLPGLFASIAMAVYLILILALFKLFSVTLTLSGIAGIVFSIGIAVDANVLIFERLKEELKKKRDLSAATEIGFTKAWPSIRDSNVSTLIICAILFVAGASIMRGFAITLGIGVLVSMFSAIFMTRVLLRVIAPKIKNKSIIKFLF
jgi:preprotein translocase subunit SecD